MKCRQCGRTLPEDSDFCQYCGCRVTDVQAEISAVPARNVPSNRTVYLTERKNAGRKCIYSLPCLLFAAVMLIIALNTKSRYSRTEIFYFVSLFFAVVTGLLVVVNAPKIIPSPLLTNLSFLFSIGALIPLLMRRMWADGSYNSMIETMLRWSLILLAVNCIVQAYYTVLTDIKLYRRSAHYKMNCYKKLEEMNALREQGIISDEEYTSFKQQITKKIP